MAGKLKIRVLSNCSLAVTAVLAAACVLLSSLGFQKYEVLRSATRDYIACEAAAKLLQEGSDNLTSQVRLAAVTGQTHYISAYFQEADETRSRERAVEALEGLHEDPDAIESLRSALDASNDLMRREYRAMRLVEEAVHAEENTWPEALRTAELTQQEQALSDKDKLELAQDLVTGREYEDAKKVISDDVGYAIGVLSTEILNRQSHAAADFSKTLELVMLCMLMFAVMMLAMCLIMRCWIVKPLLSYTDSIRKGTVLKTRGVNELQLLAQTYNQVYRENEEREMLMKHQAEHDPLTGLLNRGSFDRILNLYQKDENNFALILVDVDTFKGVNDTYGHAVGDKILQKVAAQLTTAFRAVDYVCRIGGDEFAVIMVDMTTDLSYTIPEKINEANRVLGIAEGEIPAVSLSAGAAFTDRETPEGTLFRDADKALYYTKEHGRRGCTIFPVPEEA